LPPNVQTQRLPPATTGDCNSREQIPKPFDCPAGRRLDAAPLASRAMKTAKGRLVVLPNKNIRLIKSKLYPAQIQKSQMLDLVSVVRIRAAHDTQNLLLSHAFMNAYPTWFD
jgi:hypothetical protein